MTSTGPLFFGFDQREDLYRVTNSGKPVPEETVAHYASLFPDTIYFTAEEDPRGWDVQGNYGHGWEVQGNYGHGWELVTTENTNQEALDTKRVYEENEPGTPFRVRRGEDE